MKTGIATKCFLCHSEESKDILIFGQPDMYEQAVGVSDVDYMRKWVQCAACGFSYSVYSREDGIIDNIYKSSYRDASAPWRSGTTEEIFNKVVALPAEESETKYRIQWIKDHISNLWNDRLITQGEAPYNLLDIGGGNAVFAYEFQDENWRSHIVDANASGDFIKSKLSIPFVEDYYKPGLFDVQFDLISLVFVLEHLSDPLTILKDIASDLTKNSFLYIEVPDAINFQKKPASDDIFNSCHLWMFDANSLTRLLDEAGFELMALDHVRTKRDHLALMALACKKESVKDE